MTQTAGNSSEGPQLSSLAHLDGTFSPHFQQNLGGFQQENNGSFKLSG